MCSLINKQLLLTAYAYLFIMEQRKAQQGSQALELQANKQKDAQYRKQLEKKRLANLEEDQQRRIALGTEVENIFKTHYRPEARRRIEELKTNNPNHVKLIVEAAFRREIASEKPGFWEGVATSYRDRHVAYVDLINNVLTQLNAGKETQAKKLVENFGAAKGNIRTVNEWLKEAKAAFIGKCECPGFSCRVCDATLAAAGNGLSKAMKEAEQIIALEKHAPLLRAALVNFTNTNTEYQQDFPKTEPVALETVAFFLKLLPDHQTEVLDILVRAKVEEIFKEQHQANDENRDYYLNRARRTFADKKSLELFDTHRAKKDNLRRLAGALKEGKLKQTQELQQKFGELSAQLKNSRQGDWNAALSLEKPKERLEKMRAIVSEMAKAQAREEFEAWKIKWEKTKEAKERERLLKDLTKLASRATSAGDDDLAKQIEQQELETQKKELAKILQGSSKEAQTAALKGFEKLTSSDQRQRFIDLRNQFDKFPESLKKQGAWNEAQLLPPGGMLDSMQKILSEIMPDLRDIEPDADLPYKVLELKLELPSSRRLKEAFHAASLRYHPDKNPEAEKNYWTEQQQIVINAYDKLRPAAEAQTKREEQAKAKEAKAGEEQADTKREAADHRITKQAIKA